MPGHRGAVPRPGLRRRPGPGLRPARPAGQARHPGADRPGLLQGPGPVRRGPGPGQFELDAARGDVPAGPDGTAFGLEVTQIDGTTLELFSDPALAAEFGVPSAGAKPLLRLVGLLDSGTRRWRAAAVGRYLDGENALADRLQGAFGPGQLNLADRGFFSMDRWLRLSGTGADLLWRVRNGAKTSPFKTLRTLKDGSELVLLRESALMRSRRRAAAGDPALPSLPATAARLVCFTVVTRTRSGRAKTTQVRLLTTLLDPDLCPAGELAVLYRKRWLIEIALLHLKRTVRGAGRTVRGRSPELARQEAWALLLAHNMIAGLAARAAATAGWPPATSPSPPCSPWPAPPPSPTPAARTAASARPAKHPHAGLDADILAVPPGRPGRQRTSGRTAAERRTWASEPAEYTITIIPSNLPKTDISHGS